VRRLLGCALLVLAAPAPAAPDALTVGTHAGAVHGAWADTREDVRVYRGIPYASPPVGELRFKPPQPPAAWSGVREATRPAPACMQSIVGSMLPWTREYMHNGAVSEDCLYLNLWTAAKAPSERRPVLVYIYGGGFSQGSIEVPIYDGAQLARQGVVVVMMNYRLGALGFLAHPALAGESPHHASGNYGLLDQIEALRWVRQNIAAFGGDPQRVTIAGQSAGAISAYLLTASPLAQGLFERAIIQSGPGALAAFGFASVSAMASPRAGAEQAGQKFADALQATTAQRLRALDAKQFLAPPGANGGTRFGPAVDGWVLPQDPESLYAAHRFNDVPVLIGMMADEGSAFGGYSAERAAQARALGRTATDEFLSARARVSRQPAFAYYFAHAIPWPQQPQFGAFHSGELPYTFDNLALLDRPWTATDRALAHTVSAYWVQFATSGSPQKAGLPAWPPYVPGSQQFMVFDEP